MDSDAIRFGKLIARDMRATGVKRQHAEYAAELWPDLDENQQINKIKYLLKKDRDTVTAQVPVQYRDKLWYRMACNEAPQQELRGDVRDMGAMPERPEPNCLDDIYNVAQAQQELIRNTKPIIRCKEIFIQSDVPIIFAPTSDLHVGSLGCDYYTWREQQRLITENEHVYIGWLGDGTENHLHFKNVRAVLSQVLSIDLQEQALELLVKELAPRTLFACDSNHSQHHSKACGTSQEEKLWRACGVPWFYGYALITVRVGPTIEESAPYYILAHHSPDGQSINNICHGLNKMWKKQFQADIVTAGHIHQPALQMDLANMMARAAGLPFGGERLYLLAGTANVDAEYALYGYGDNSAAIWPCAVLFPRKRKIRGQWTLEDALIYRRGLTNE